MSYRKCMRLFKFLFTPIGAILFTAVVCVCSVPVGSAPEWMRGIGAFIILAISAFVTLRILPPLLSLAAVLLVASNQIGLADLMAQAARLLYRCSSPRSM